MIKNLLDFVNWQIVSQGKHQQYSRLLSRKIAAADRSQRIIILRTVAIDRTIGSGTADDGDFTFERFDFTFPRRTQVAVADSGNDDTGSAFCKTEIEPVIRRSGVSVKNSHFREIGQVAAVKYTVLAPTS